MATASFTDTELICFDHGIITIIRKIKNQHQRADFTSIHKRSSKFQAIMMFPKNSSIFELKLF